tara:strand:- start:63 stop:383 length:321 start_codon:yes stop_codon:yes gene_type:complete
MFKKILIIFTLFLLNNCVTPSSALLAPVFTAAKTGSIYQASLSYSTGKIMNEINSHKNKENNDYIYPKKNTILPDIPYVEKDPIIITKYKVSLITFTEITEPEPLP